MNNTVNLSEEQLIFLLKQDKLSAFREIYIRYWKGLYGEAYKRLKNRDLAEEVVQDLFAAFWKQRHALDISLSVEAYLHTAVRHHVINQYRKELVRQKHQEAFKIIYTEADTSTEDGIMLKELTTTIETEVSRLPDKCRSVYELSRKEHKSNKEIALYLGISEKTVENHLTKALKRLRFGLHHYLTIVLYLLVK